MGRPPKDGSQPVQRADREAQAEEQRVIDFHPPPVPETLEELIAFLEEYAGTAETEDVAIVANVHVDELKEGGRFANIYARAARWKNLRVGLASYEKGLSKKGSPIPGVAWMNNGLWKQKKEPDAKSDGFDGIEVTVVNEPQSDRDGDAPEQETKKPRKKRAKAAASEAQAPEAEVPEVGAQAPREGPV